MMIDKLFHSDLQDDELLARWRYGGRQREMLSVLNEIFDQFVPLSDDEVGLEFSDVSNAARV